MLSMLKLVIVGCSVSLCVMSFALLAIVYFAQTSKVNPRRLISRQNERFRTHHRQNLPRSSATRKSRFCIEMGPIFRYIIRT